MEGHIKRKFSQQGSPHLPHCYICSVPFTATNKRVICKKCNNSCCKPHCLNVSKTSNGLICEICHRFKIRLTMLRSMGIDLQKMQNSLFELYDRKEIIEADLAKQDIQIKRLQINISTVTEEQQSVYNGLQEKINNEMAKAEGYIGVSEKLYQALNSSAESEQARKQKLVKLQREKEHVLQQTSEIQAKIDLLSVDVQVKHNRLTQQHQLGKIKDQLCSICRNKLKNRRRSLSNYQSSRNASIRKSETISCSFLCCGRKI